MDEVKIESDRPDPERARNMKVGAYVIIGGISFIALVIIAIPFVAMLYRWGFGG